MDLSGGFAVAVRRPACMHSGRREAGWGHGAGRGFCVPFLPASSEQDADAGGRPGAGGRGAVSFEVA